LRPVAPTIVQHAPTPTIRAIVSLREGLTKTNGYHSVPILFLFLACFDQRNCFSDVSWLLSFAELSAPCGDTARYNKPGAGALGAGFSPDASQPASGRSVGGYRVQQRELDMYSQSDIGSTFHVEFPTCCAQCVIALLHFVHVFFFSVYHFLYF